MHHLCQRATSKKRQKQQQLAAAREAFLKQGGTIDVLPANRRSTRPLTRPHKNSVKYAKRRHIQAQRRKPKAGAHYADPAQHPTEQAPATAAH